MRANVAIFNENCSISQVAFYVDGNSSAPVVVRFEVCLFCDLCFFFYSAGNAFQVLLEWMTRDYYVELMNIVPTKVHVSK
jgi:hypothetical protein